MPNLSNVQPKATESTPYDKIQPFQGVILGIIATPGIIGNIFALVVTAKLLKAQKLTINVFVFGLCCCDLAGIVTVCVPTWLCYIFRGWQGGDRLCNFQGFATIMFTMGSGMMATLMSIDRVVSIKAPVFHLAKVNIRVTSRLVVAVLLFSAVFAIMPVLGFGSFVLNLSGTYCTINWFAERPADKAFSYLFATFGILMILAVVISNITVVILLFQKRRARINLKGMRTTKAKEVSANERIEIQVTRMMILISILFLVCWTPFMFRILGNISGFWISSAADLNASRLLLLNLVLDPFIYVLTRQHYRRTLKDLVCHFCIKHKKAQYLSDKKGSSSTGFTGLKSRSNSTPSSQVIERSRDGNSIQDRYEMQENLKQKSVAQDAPGTPNTNGVSRVLKNGQESPHLGSSTIETHF